MQFNTCKGGEREHEAVEQGAGSNRPRMRERRRNMKQ